MSTEDQVKKPVVVEDNEDVSVKVINKSGRTWKETKRPFKPQSQNIKNKNISSWEFKKQQRLEQEQFKQKLKEMKQEKNDEKHAKAQRIRDRREKKEEKERYERLAVKMHAKKIERLKRREKRNKALKER